MKAFIKIISYVLALLLLPITARGEGATEIYDRAGLETIALDPMGNYVLVADINLCGADWEPFAFYGSLDGGGHTIYNMRVSSVGDDRATTMDGNHIEYETDCAALFSVVRGASFTNLGMVNAETVIESDTDCYAATLAGYAEGSTFTDCTVMGRVTLSTTAKAVGVGGLVGFSEESVFERCTVDTELCFIDTNRDMDCEQFLGGLFACGSARIFDCVVRVRGYASVFGYAHNGGMVGMHILTRKNKSFRTKLARCTVDAEITFFEEVASRRAYCEALIGENLAGDCYLSGNTVASFVRNEVDSSDTVLLPESCAIPQIQAVVTPPTCTEWGYTTHTCTLCGHSRTDSFTSPRHNLEARVTKPSAGKEGYVTYVCLYCGIIESTEAIPMLALRPLIGLVCFAFLFLDYVA